MDQAPLRQPASAGMFRQERHPEPGNRRVAKGEEINASQARFVADRALRAIWPGEGPSDLAHLIRGGQRRQIRQRRHIAAGAEAARAGAASTRPNGQLQRTTPRGSPSASDTMASACCTSKRSCCAICRRSLARAIQRADAPPSKIYTPKTVRFFFRLYGSSSHRPLCRPRGTRSGRR
jgi:hypothetical protein